MDTKIGFIGLGIMGVPMSKNLLKAGFELSVWNRTASRMDELTREGVRAGRSAAVVAEWSDITITMLTDSEAVEEVMMHSYNGVIAGAKEGSVVIDMSTISPSVTRSVADSLRENGVHMLDAPVSGSLPGATSGTLSIMVGGDADVFERCLPVFRAMGRTITHCGPNGMGQVTKLANQIIGMGNLAAMCEGIVFAARAGGRPGRPAQGLSARAPQTPGWSRTLAGRCSTATSPRASWSTWPRRTCAWSRRPPRSSTSPWSRHRLSARCSEQCSAPETAATASRPTSRRWRPSPV